jgi:hypothetical protein
MSPIDQAKRKFHTDKFGRSNQSEKTKILLIIR